MDVMDVAFVLFFVSLVVAAVYAVSRSPELILPSGSARLALAPTAAEESRPAPTDRDDRRPAPTTATTPDRPRAVDAA